MEVHVANSPSKDAHGRSPRAGLAVRLACPSRNWHKAAWIGLLVALLGSGCANASRQLYAPDAFRMELARRLPDVPPNDLVVPFEVPAEAVERAREKVARYRTEREQARQLVELLSDERGFGLGYKWAINNSASTTLAGGGGNCLGLSSLLVGLARSVGLRAFYLDATRDPERREEASLRIAAGHVAVVILTSDGPLFVDFTGELPRGWRYRRMTDLQATAHYYNNLGYEIIHRSLESNRPVPWQAVQREFARATRIAPGLATAWNNVGVAASRLGRPDQAERSYRRASLLDPDLESPRENLAVLLAAGGSEPSLTHVDAGSSADAPRSGSLTPNITTGNALPETIPEDSLPRDQEGSSAGAQAADRD